MKTQHLQTLEVSATRKAYKKPSLKFIGKVATITKANKGSVDDDGGGTLKP
ncbi:hypothetical protein [Dyadobacter psychrotolerans]|uniref:hypothetical protein n=1 Tax=Dyadobacter psychrotolerans TaxID=2541721 RepID=UPI0014049551|nr:hypothetical protein [Dyadobacter psychrotolerans]